MKKESIHIVGARTHNLRNISLHIPQEEMTVVTGVSGSGKSSLAFDTLYAEGQRRYVESLSAYARQFLGRMQKPDVDKIDNIPPAIAIEQKTTSRNPRSTVGTVTEIYDYLKLLFARIGRTISPISGEEVKRHTIRDVVDAMSAQEKGSRIYLLSPLFNQEQKPNKEKIAILQEQGFSRLWKDGETLRISDLMSGDKIDSLSAEGKDIYLMVDRIVADGEQATANRLPTRCKRHSLRDKGRVEWR